jgi:hypothetical protein
MTSEVTMRVAKVDLIGFVYLLRRESWPLP